jgi:hypothetical protein
MKHKKIHVLRRATSAIALAASLVGATPAYAASSWNPGLLVNTESFQVIDEGDSTTDVELRFGGTINEKIFWDVETGRFEFTDDVHVQGNFTATGTLITDGAISTKSNLTINSDNGAVDAVLTFGNTAAETLTFSNASDRFQFSDDVYLAQTLTVDGNTTLNGGTFTIGDASGDAVTVNSAAWTFANDTTVALTGGVNGLNFDSNTLSIDATNNRIGIGTAAPAYEVDAVGSIHASVGLSSSGSLVWEGSASGASLWVARFKGAGLVSTCDATTGKLTWDSTLQQFVCGTDSGTTYTAGQGLTLAGSVFSLSSSFSGTGLEIMGTASGRIVHAQDQLRSSGTLITTGNISTRADLTINSDQTAGDAVLTFGQPSTNETITFSNTRGRFEFSDDIKTSGYLSGATLTVDGTVTFRGQAMNFPTNTGASGSVLRTDGAGNLGWYTSAGDGSGDIINLQPEYPNAIYYQSGSSYIGQLAGSGGLNSGFENTYQWTSTKASIQDYWVSTRIRVPDNFLRWDPVKSLQLRYRTKTGTTSQNHVTVKLLDTTGAAVALTGGATLASTSFATANITGPSSAGTYTPGGFITVLVKLAANSSGQANAGYMTLHWETRNP